MSLLPMSLPSPGPRPGPSYTIQFKNGQLLRHQGPLVLAQFQSDIRLAGFWPESTVALSSPSAPSALTLPSC
jgi:hypothetical protein